MIQSPPPADPAWVSRPRPALGADQTGSYAAQQPTASATDRRPSGRTIQLTTIRPVASPLPNTQRARVVEGGTPSRGWMAGRSANRAREASQTLAACLTLPASGRVRPSNILPVCVRRAPVPDRIRSRNIRPWRCGHTRSHSHRVTRTYSQVTTACGRAVGLRHPVQHMYTLIVPASRRGRGVRVTWKNTNCTTHRRFFDQSSRNIYAHLIMELLFTAVRLHNRILPLQLSW